MNLVGANAKKSRQRNTTFVMDINEELNKKGGMMWALLTRSDPEMQTL